MSTFPWDRLPARFLKMKYFAFSKLPWDVQELIADLAEKQKFACAICEDAASNLEIEHEHGPGERVPYSVKNIRGLACRSCNNQISLYERHEDGSYSGLDNVYPWIASHVYEAYIYAFECRVFDLNERQIRQTIGDYQYHCKRNPLLDKLDRWEGWGEPYPWGSYVREIKMRRSPKYALKVMFACAQFCVDEFKRNPTWEPPDHVILFLFQLKSFLEEVEEGLPEEIRARIAARQADENVARSASH